ncbi:MAG: hypothetical protein RL477_717 [Pseudomonadota bacterium]
MAPPATPQTAPRRDLAPLVSVIDIGSNSVRMVVYSGDGRTSVPVYNERTLCGLGKALGKTGRLDPEAVSAALAHLARFSEIMRAMGVRRIEALATEAVRAASDGADFVAAAERVLGSPITILDGATEAETSAFGVISGIPGADGMMGDLGGGSLEIVALDAGRPGQRASLPIGALRLREATDGDVGKAEKIVDAAIARVDWLGRIRDRTFYPVGGAWRAFAAVRMGQENYPLHVIHQYALGEAEALALLRLVAHLSPKSLARIPRVPKARLKTLPLAAVVMERLLVAARPRRVVFSAFGLREGWLYRGLDPALREEDPLLAAAGDIARRESRFAMPGPQLDAWLDVLFPGEEPRLRRLRRAAVLLSDIAWRDHPDYRARDSYSRVLHLPLTGIDHRERVLLAYMVSASYGGGRTGPTRSLLLPLVEDDEVDHAITVGRALRFARTLAAGTPDVLRQTSIEIDKENLTLRVPAGKEWLLSEEAGRRFEALARRLDRKAVVRAKARAAEN